MADSADTATAAAAAATGSDELGFYLSYAALGIMAVVPIYVGAKRSVRKDARKPGEVPPQSCFILSNQSIKDANTLRPAPFPLCVDRRRWR